MGFWWNEFCLVSFVLGISHVYTEICLICVSNSKYQNMGAWNSNINDKKILVTATGFEPATTSFVNFRYCVCSEQGVPRRSDNYKVKIY